MDEGDLNKIFSYPNLLIINLLLSLVNLTNREKRVIELHYFNGYTIEQVSELLQLSPRTISSTLQKLKKKCIKVFSTNQLALEILKDNY